MSWVANLNLASDHYAHQLSVFDTEFRHIATGALHKFYIGQKNVIAGTDTMIINISNGSPIRQ